MSFFLTYDAENWEYHLTTPGYVVLVILMVAALVIPIVLSRKNNKKMSAKQLTFCAVAMALALVTSFIKVASLPMGGSITLFSMFFMCFIGYLYGPKIGIMTGVAYGILQLIIEPYIYAPLQVLLDYPLAFGALGLSGLFSEKKYGLYIGYVVAILGRFLCSFLSGFIFFGEYAPEGMNPVWYSFVYNILYIGGEGVLTLIVLALPPVKSALVRLKAQMIK